MAPDPLSPLEKSSTPGPAKDPGPERKWTTFSRSMVSVLAASILLVTAAIASLAITRILQQAESDGARRAADLARFVARTSFVAVSLEDRPLLEQAVAFYLDDPDLVYLTVADARGNILLARQVNPASKAGHLVEVTRPISPPVESDAEEQTAVGEVRVGLSLARSFATARRAAAEIALGSLGLLGAALAMGLTLISGMTERMKELVGEARLVGELQRSNEQLEAFSYSVAHDLRAPLRHIDGFIDLLDNNAEGKLDDEGKRYLSIIAGSAKRMGVLIDDLLLFSRTARAELHKTRCDLGTILRQVLEEFEPETQNRSVEWRIATLPQVDCDPSMMRLVFQNLIGNALKFTRRTEKTVIEIGPGEGRPGRAVVFVRDNGVGFDMAYAKNLFGVFQRMHTRGEFEGTGIGLANVRRIVERHGGEIWAEAKPNEGAAFFFALPTGKSPR